jgi:hypothetical protein
MADGKIELELTLEDGSVVKALTNVETAAKKTGDNVEKDLFDGFKKGLKKVSVAASVAIAASLGATVKAIAEGIQAEDSLNKFNASLRAAGLFSQQTSNDFQNFASRLQETTKYTDEQVLSLSSLSLNYARNADEAKKLTEAAIALSAATGKDVESSMQQLGATLQGNVGKLANMEGGFANLTKKQLESGAAVDLVIKRFGELAGSETKTFSGILNQISKSFDDLVKSFGLIIVQNPKLKAALGVILESLRDLAKNVDIDAVTNKINKLLEASANLGMLLGTVVAPVLELSVNIVKEFIRGLSYLGDVVNFVLLGQFQAAGETAKRGLEEIKTNLSNYDVSLAVTEFAEKFKTAIDGAASIISPAAGKTGKDAGIKLREEFTTEALKLDEFQQNFQIAFKNIGAGALAAIGGSFVKGKSAFKDFGKTALSMLGDLAIQTGIIISGMGQALTALAAALSNPFTGFLAIAAGAALIVLGGALKALAGGGGGGGGAVPGGGVATATAAGISSDGNEQEFRDQGTSLVVNVQGSVFDSEETGLRISDIIKTNFDRRDVRFA